MSRFRLLLHIGSYKTGTTALEAFLSHNKAVLAGRGILYDLDGGASNNHHAIAYASYADAIRLEKIDAWCDSSLPDAAKLIEQVEARRQEVGASTVILSAETFYTTATVENHLWSRGLSAEQCDRIEQRQVQRLGELLAAYDVTVVCYLRRQDHWITSMYNQVLKHADLTPTWDEIIAQYALAMQYDFQIARWARVFGRGRTQVRVYEKAQMPGGIVPDFLENVLHLKLTGDFRPFETSDVVLQGNRGLSRDVLEFKRVVSRLGRMDDAFPFRDFMRVSEEMGGFEQYAEVAPPAARRELVCRYDAGNACVASEYLGRGDGRLFLEPLPSPGDPYQSYPGLSTERAVEIGCRLWRLWRRDWQERLQATEARLERLEAKAVQIEAEGQQLAAQLQELRLRRQAPRALARAIPRPVRGWLRRNSTIRSLYARLCG